jgi:diguanylate cyclase (GGDEF)-like protein
LFIDRTLETQQRYPWVSRALRGAAALTVVVAVVFCAGGIDYRTAQLIAMSMGPIPMVLGVPVAWARARQGDVAARFIFLGWALYAVGVASMIMLLRGWLPGNFWTQHAFQFSSMLEMSTWMLVLGARTDTLRQSAEAVAREHDRMRFLAHTDPLTGLLNRRGLDESLGALLDAATAHDMVAYFELDLDGFKPVNDLHGHDIGDALLIEVGRRLKSALRGHQDLVARTGGDEFVIVTTGLADARWAEHIGQKLLRLFQTPFEVEGHTCRVGATIGYALAPLDGSDTQVLMRRADEALYAGKHGGRNQVRRTAA